MAYQKKTLGRLYKLSGPDGEDILHSDTPDDGNPRSDELIRLQALLSQWLRIENIVVLMGSGCSTSHEGLSLAKLEKTVLSFLKDYYRLYEEGEVDLYNFVSERLDSLGNEKVSSFEAWLSCLSNVEHLVCRSDSPISDISWKNGVNLKPEKLQDLLSDLQRAIYLWCSLQLPSPERIPTGHHAFMAKLIARDPSLGRAKIFTLNYDTLIEQALDHLGIQYADGFVGQAERRFEPSCYGIDMYYPGDVSEGRVRRYDKFIQLYKLHGSIHWWEREEGSDVLATHPRLGPFPKWRNDYKETEKVDKEKFDSLFKDMPGEMGILPTSSKHIQTLDLPYAHLFRAFHQSLQQPQTFFITIGYGFGDEHVNRIIEDALINPSFVMLVVDPKPSEKTKKKIQSYQLMGARVYLLSPLLDIEIFSSDAPATFDDFASKILPNVSWLDDWIKLKKIENTLKHNSQKRTETSMGSGDE